jgi:hypothetical protein
LEGFHGEGFRLEKRKRFRMRSMYDIANIKIRGVKYLMNANDGAGSNSEASPLVASQEVVASAA